MAGELKPCMVWPLADFLAEEMTERGWTCVDVAIRMPGEYEVNVAVVNMTLAVPNDPNLLIDNETFAELATAFGVSEQMLRRLHQTWLDNPDARQPFTCPEHLLAGLLFTSNDNGPDDTAAPRDPERTG